MAASRSFRASECFSRSQSFSTSKSFTHSESFSVSKLFPYSESFSVSASFTLPDQTKVITPDTDDTNSQLNNENSNIPLIAGVLAAIVAVALVVATVLICYIKKMACFGSKGDQSGSEIEATADAWTIGDHTTTVPLTDNFYSQNSDVAQDPFVQIMEYHSFFSIRKTSAFGIKISFFFSSLFGFYFIIRI